MSHTHTHIFLLSTLPCWPGKGQWWALGRGGLFSTGLCPGAYGFPQPPLRRSVGQRACPFAGVREGQARLKNGTHSDKAFSPPLPPNLNYTLGSERGCEPNRGLSQAGTGPSSHCAQTARARRGRGARDTCPQAPGRGVEVGHDGGHGVIDRADPAQAGSLGTPGSCSFPGRSSRSFLQF